MEYEEKKVAVQKKLELTDRELDRLVASDKNGTKINLLFKGIDNTLPKKDDKVVQNFWYTPQRFFDVCCEVSDLDQVTLEFVAYE